jgi:undecaprenyl-diphosphatase
MTAGLFLNLTRSSAARFSFLLSIPAVLASGLHEVTSLTSDPFAVGTANLLVATIVAGISGYAAIAWLLKFLMNRTMMVFVWYRIGLGVLLAVMLYTGIVQP